MLSLDFFESWWIVLSRKNPRKLFPALWIPIWMLLNVLAESVLNAFGSNFTKTLGNSRVKLRCSRLIFLKADGSYFPGKIRENYFRHSGYWFGCYWMCWLNWFWTHSEAILPKLQVIREWSYDALVGLFWKLMDSTFQEKSEKIISGTLDTDLDATECVGWIGFE